MSNLTNKDWPKTNYLNKSVNLSGARRGECFMDRNVGIETSFNTKQNALGGTRPSNLKLKEVNQLFKVPNFDSLPVKKATVKSIISPRRRVQAGRVKNDLKSSQTSKMSFLPRPSFINSRKTMNYSRSNQVNARKELIKKMVYLTECALKENRDVSREIKKQTPVKALAGLTPRKTPKGYLVLPEFTKTFPKMEDVRSPMQDFIRKQTFSYAVKPPSPEKKIETDCVDPSEENKSNLNLELKASANIPDGTFCEILNHCRNYNTEVNSIHEKMKTLDEGFENDLNDVPDYEVYNKFCVYQSKKEELYNELQCLEEELKNFIKTNLNIGNKLKDYMSKKRQLFEKQNNFHKDFEKVINNALEKNCIPEEDEEEKKEANEDIIKNQTPKLRRSLRLSRLQKKAKFEERTPMTRKLKKLNSKSKGIQRASKVSSP